MSSEREAKSALEQRVSALEESKAKLETEARASEAKCLGLAEASAEAESRLESLSSERKTLLEMNEDLSMAAQEHLCTISKLQVGKSCGCNIVWVSHPFAMSCAVIAIF